MTWLERGLYLAILIVLGVGIAAMKQRNGKLSEQAAAAQAGQATAAAAGEEG